MDFWPSHTELSKILNFMASRGEFLWAGFANNESLYRRMSTKYKSSKLFWRILEDNKQNKRENWGKETLRICACKSPIADSVPHVLETATISFPFCLRFAFRRQILAYFDELYQQIHVCLSVTRYFFGNEGNKASQWSKHGVTRWRQRIMLIMII